MPSVFITYRRADTSGHAGRLAERLKSEFGTPNVFMDVDAIVSGQDFAKRIEEGVASCDVLLVMIGHQWLTAKNDAGERRLDDPEDFIRLEVETGLEREVVVIPVLVEGAQLPAAKDLPASMSNLARHQAIELRNSSWRHDVDRLISAIWQLSSKPGFRSRLARTRARLKSVPTPVKVAALLVPALVVLAAVALAGGSGSKGGAKLVGGEYLGTTSQGKTCQANHNKDGWATGPTVPCIVRLTFSGDRKYLVRVNDLQYHTTCSGHPFSVTVHSGKNRIPLTGSHFNMRIGLQGGFLAEVGGTFTPGRNTATGSFTTKHDSTRSVACQNTQGTFKVSA